jgi:hypothetical protein
VRYRELWDRLLAEARKISVESAVDEARAFLRLHLRSVKDASSRDAAKQLIHLLAIHAKLHSAEAPADDQILKLLEECPDAQLDALIAVLDHAHQERSQSGASGEAVPVGPDGPERLRDDLLHRPEG